MPRFRQDSERLKYQEMSRSLLPVFLGRGKYPLPSFASARAPLRSASSRAGQGSPHPAQPTPLLVFILVFSVSLSLFYLVASVFVGARLSHRRHSGNSPRLISPCALTHPPFRAHPACLGKRITSGTPYILEYDKYFPAFSFLILTSFSN